MNKLISEWTVAVEAWLDGSKATKFAYEVFVRRGTEESRTDLVSKQRIALECAARVVELGQWLAAELARNSHDSAGVLLLAHLAEQNADGRPPTMEEASRVLADWPSIRARLQAVGLQALELETQDNGATAAELLELVSPDGAQVLLIAQDETKTAETKMRLIVALDQRYAGYDSEQWAGLLGVKPPAIRKLPYWKNDLRAAE